MDKTVPLSFSIIKTFENCPYKARMTTKALGGRYLFKPTPASELGNRMHKAFEDYISYGTPLPEEFAKHEFFMSKLRASVGTKTCEHKMALNWKQEPVDYFKGRNLWLRGQYDLMIMPTDTHGVMIDYKTGKAKYPDLDQLQCMSMMAFHYFPKLNEIRGALVFVEEGYKTFKETFTRAKMPVYVDEWKRRAIPIIQALNTNVWQPRENPLCGWCPVVECPFHKGS